MSDVYLSHTRKGVMQTCGKKYFYQYVEKRVPASTSANLVFGTAIHAGCSAYLTAQAFGGSTNPIEVFDAEWQKAKQDTGIAYSSKWDWDGLRDTGHRLMELFQEDWTTRGWHPVLDTEGLPLVERSLRVRLPSGIIFTSVMDAVVRTLDGRILIVDFKTPSTATPDGFAEMSDQLTGYQAAAEANALSLGIEKVDGMVFYNLTKRPIPKTSRGMGPTIDVEEPTAPRKPDAIKEWLAECEFVADDIRRKRFYRRPMDAYNSPCALCDFASLCRGIQSAEPTSDNTLAQLSTSSINF